MCRLSWPLSEGALGTGEDSPLGTERDEDGLDPEELADEILNDSLDLEDGNDTGSAEDEAAAQGASHGPRRGSGAWFRARKDEPLFPGFVTLTGCWLAVLCATLHYI